MWWSVLLTKKFIKKIESYIKKHLKEPQGKCSKSFRHIKAMTVVNGYVCIDYFSPEEFERMRQKLREVFPEYFLSAVSHSGLTESEICKKAHLDRRIFSKLRERQNYLPRKRTIIKTAVALELELNHVRFLLRCAGCPLSQFNREDVILRFLFENRIFDWSLINDVLNHFGFKGLI